MNQATLYGGASLNRCRGEAAVNFLVVSLQAGHRLWVGDDLFLCLKSSDPCYNLIKSD